MNIQKILVGVAAGVVMLGATIVPAFANTIIYNNMPGPIPGNVPSQAFEATQTSEFGGQVQFDGIARLNPNVTVLMSSWGCQTGNWFNNNCVSTSGATFTHPVTLNVYNVNADNSVGSLITTKTQTFTMPYRPSADNTNCTLKNAGKWFDGTTCFNGKAFTISFNLSGVTLPGKVILSVAYNTSDYGVTPLRPAPCDSDPAGCPYDSLNVGTNSTPSVGTALPTINDAYLNSSNSGSYCSSSTTPGTFQLDSGCWTGFLPAFEVDAQLPAPLNKNQCKDDGWQNYSDANGNPFKNQGDCVSYVQSNPNATGNKNK